MIVRSNNFGRFQPWYVRHVRTIVLSNALLIALASLFLLPSAESPPKQKHFESEFFRSFSAKIDLAVSGYATVTETINFHSNLERIKRGICRDYSKMIKRPDGVAQAMSLKLNWVMLDKNFLLSDAENVMDPVKDNGKFYRICYALQGKPLPPGDHQISANYSLFSPIVFNSQKDSFQWTTGIFPLTVNELSITVGFPKGISADSINSSWLFRKYLADMNESVAEDDLSVTNISQPLLANLTQGYSKDNTSVIQFTPRQKLERGEGFVLNLNWPRGGFARLASTPTPTPVSTPEESVPTF